MDSLYEDLLLLEDAHLAIIFPLSLTSLTVWCSGRCSPLIFMSLLTANTESLLDGDRVIGGSSTVVHIVPTFPAQRSLVEQRARSLLISAR